MDFFCWYRLFSTVSYQIELSLLNPIKKERVSNTEQDEADKDKLLKCLLSSLDIKITSYLGVFLALQR